MKEVWDLYDAKGNKTGYTLVRGRPIPEGCYHLVVSVWIINNSLGGALREVNEELGIILNPKDGQRISRICREQTRDLYDVWVFYKDVDISDITLQETEVVDVKWVTDEELIKMERKGELHPLLALTM